MKKNIFLLIIIVLFIKTNNAYSQETKVSWYDDKGREFSISAPSGNFSYTILPGDNITYGSRFSNSPGKEVSIGDIIIEYGGPYSNSPGKIIKVGDVRVEYGGKYSDFPGNVIKIGGLSIEYGGKYSNAPGKIVQTTGKVR